VASEREGGEPRGTYRQSFSHFSFFSLALFSREWQRGHGGGGGGGGGGGRGSGAAGGGRRRGGGGGDAEASLSRPRKAEEREAIKFSPVKFDSGIKIEYRG
jgi:hypothetical protein